MAHWLKDDFTGQAGGSIWLLRALMIYVCFNNLAGLTYSNTTHPKIGLPGQIHSVVVIIPVIVFIIILIFLSLFFFFLVRLEFELWALHLQRRYS
jgi:hypothetical protein